VLDLPLGTCDDVIIDDFDAQEGDGQGKNEDDGKE
jgi:hypothetical protein